MSHLSQSNHTRMGNVETQFGSLHWAEVAVQANFPLPACQCTLTTRNKGKMLPLKMHSTTGVPHGMQ